MELFKYRLVLLFISRFWDIGISYVDDLRMYEHLLTEIFANHMKKERKKERMVWRKQRVIWKKRETEKEKKNMKQFIQD